MSAKTTGREAAQLAQLSQDLGIRFAYPNSQRILVN